MRTTIRISLQCGAALFLAGAAAAQAANISLTVVSGGDTQNFDTYAGTSGTVPSGFGVTFSGTSTFNGRSSGTGSTFTAGAWALGSGSDYSLGAVRGTTPGNITLTVGFKNDTATTIRSLTFGWNYEQWRYGGTSGLDASGTGELATNATLNGLDFTGATSGTHGVVSSTEVQSFTLSGLSIANGKTFGISWVTTSPGGTANGVSIDDFSYAYSTVAPEPACVALFAAAAFGLRRRRR